MTVTTEFGNEKTLQFNPDKSATVIFNSERLGIPRELRIQGKNIDFQAANI